MSHTFKEKVWLYPGQAAWHFITLPKALGDQLRLEQGPDFRKAMLKVEVKIGETRWNTSIFWDKRRGSFLLPLKAEVRKKEAIQLGEEREVRIELK